MIKRQEIILKDRHGRRDPFVRVTDTLIERLPIPADVFARASRIFIVIETEERGSPTPTHPPI